MEVGASVRKCEESIAGEAAVVGSLSALTFYHEVLVKYSKMCEGEWERCSKSVLYISAPLLAHRMPSGLHVCLLHSLNHRTTTFLIGGLRFEFVEPTIRQPTIEGNERIGSLSCLQTCRKKTRQILRCILPTISPRPGWLGLWGSQFLGASGLTRGWSAGLVRTFCSLNRLT